ncbi:MAG TPA: hypothetical protein VGH28_21705 [Polyangiaceae bacterium]|jgi:hypothetical protein
MRGVALILGDRVVSRCDSGRLVVEYMLFDSAEVLVAGGGLGVREQGYLTTAGLARARLEKAGVTVALAQEAFSALKPGHLRALARSPVVFEAIERLGPYEAFEGGRFDPETRRYDGVWLDLDALARSCPLADAGLLFQALHLRVAVEEADADAAVRMSTAQLTEDRRPNERTWERTPLENVARLPRVLAQMRVPPRTRTSDAIDQAEVREELLRNLRTRSAAAPEPDTRLGSLARRLSRPPSVPPEGGARKPSSVPPEPDFIVTDGPDEVAQAPAPPQPRNADALFEDLRRHSEMLRGENHLQAVAKFLSASATEASLPELAVLASRAWLAAGEKGHARFFARKLVEDVDAPDEVRLMALEILESTAPTNESRMPPPIDAHALDEKPAERIVPAPIVIPSLPPLPASEKVLAVVPRAPAAEIVETMPLAKGLDETMLGAGDAVRTPKQAHVAMTRLARALARDYRLAYGTTLKTDPMAIEAMQRQLRRRAGEAPREKELLRHGALFSEILARSLGAEWDDVEGDPARWVMVVPPSTRVSPIARVMRFFERGHRESDLVAFFLELEKSARGR